MQNRYTGDIGDFGKYSLLRASSGFYPQDNEPPLRLGVVWCMVGDEGHNDDGGLVSYLASGKYHDLDPDLHDALGHIVGSGKRCVAEIHSSKIFPRGTVFFDNELLFSDLPGWGKTGRAARIERRRVWVKRALGITAECNLVFFDPDNGIASDRVSPTSIKAPKFSFMDEMRQFRDRNQSLVLYHHLGRKGTADQQIGKWKGILAAALGTASVWAIPFRRGTCRVFFIIPAKQHEGVIGRRVMAWLERGWIEHAKGKNEPEPNSSDFLR
jgi:hypothetical protein